jgi:hypothetical protein
MFQTTNEADRCSSLGSNKCQCLKKYKNHENLKKTIEGFHIFFWCPIVWTYAVHEEGFTEGKYEIIIFKIVLARTMNKKTDMLIVVDDNDKHK